MQYIPTPNANPLNVIRAMRPTAIAPTATHQLRTCPRCKSRDELHPAIFSYRVHVPFKGMVEKHTQLCSICRSEIQ